MTLKHIKSVILLLIVTFVGAGCSQISEDISNIEIQQPTTKSTEQSEVLIEPEPLNASELVSEEPSLQEANSSSFYDSSYTEVSADSCSLSGGRVANAKVDVGYDSDYANREYWAYTNSYGQLIHVEADEIILQNDDQEISGDDRYCNDEAKVPGTEQADLDEGHVIADSLGGASNAYNITPQGSQLNRYGTQADIEEDIRSAGGATNFVADIEYPDTETQIPTSYTITYTIDGNEQTYTFANDYTADGSEPTTDQADTTDQTTSTDNVYYENCTAVRDAGANPIHSDDPGYSSKLDRDGDGIACE